MQEHLGILKAGVAILALALAAGCASDTDNVPPNEAAFTFDDCALIAAIGKQRYNFTRDDPPTRVMLNGEDARWTPNCDWQAMGFNLLGPEAAGADRMAEVTFNRPQYDDRGVDVRTSFTPVSGATDAALCRLKREDGGWKIDTCGPDPRLTEPRAAPPSPADVTPDSDKPALPADGTGAGAAAPRQSDIPDPAPN